MTRRQFAPLIGAAAAQVPQTPPGKEKDESRLPDGRLRSEQILRADFKDNLKDLDEIKKLADEVKQDVEKSSGQVLSLVNLKKLEQVEKLSQRIRTRMRRY